MVISLSRCASFATTRTRSSGLRSRSCTTSIREPDVYGIVDGLHHATAGAAIGEQRVRGARGRRTSSRALEAATMTFELMLDAATYSDLAETRVAVPATQRLTCRLGFDTPVGLADLGLVETYQDALMGTYDTWERSRRPIRSKRSMWFHSATAPAPSGRSACGSCSR